MVFVGDVMVVVNFVKVKFFVKFDEMIGDVEKVVVRGF